MEFDLTKVAKKALQNVVNNTLYRGKPIIDWINFIANNADDLISRQAAIDSLLEALYDLDEYDFVDKVFIEEELKRVPSVQPEQKTGRWIYKERNILINTSRISYGENGAVQEKRWAKVKKPYCSECGWYEESEYEATPYCPNCGAKMESEEIT